MLITVPTFIFGFCYKPENILIIFKNLQTCEVYI